MNFSATLMNRIREVKRQAPIKLDSREAALNSLAVLYDACVASEQLLLDAASECKRRGESVLGDYYLSHFEEEKGEIGLLEEDLGDVLKDRPPNPGVMAMIGSQYYMLKHVHPVCLLGYMAIQEADPVPIETVERWEEAYGKELFRFVRLHAIKDIEHAKELLDVIDQQRLTSLITFSADNALGFMYGRR